MKNKKAKAEVKKADRNQLYDLTTPLWQKYYQRVRSTVRFPRYYKDALNW